MLYLPTFLLSIIQLFLAVLLLRVYPTATKKKQVILLFGITITLTAWTIVNTILLRDVQNINEINTFNTINNLGYLIGGLAVWQIYNFSDYYPISRQLTRQKKLVKIFLFLCFLISYFSPISGVNTFNSQNNTASYVPGKFGLLFVIFIFITLFLFANNVRQSIKESPESKKQAVNLMTGLILTSIQSMIFILFLPTIFGQKDIFYVFGYASTIYFILYTSYGLLKQQLFDFKDVAARATGYIFSTVFVVIVYSFLGFVFRSTIAPDTIINRAQFFSSIAITVVLIILYPMVKKIFDKLTNSLFFRDAYDAQSLLDELNKTLVSNVQINNLLTKSAQIIETNFKSHFCSFFIRDTSYFTSRLIGYDTPELSKNDLAYMQLNIPKIRKSIINTEDTAESIEEKEIVRIVKKYDAQLLIRLVNYLDNSKLGVGYMLMGTKRSGGTYAKQDIKILEIIANELVIAIENVLRFEEIEQFNMTLQKKIDGATKELKKSNEKLKALDEAKDEFISMASHQLRTPLTSVKGYLSMLAEGDAGKLNDTQNKFIDQAFVSSQRMVYLIADLLNVSRLKTGKFIIEPKPVYLPDVIESEISQLYETVKARGIKMTFNKPKTFPIVNLDEVKLRQVIMNFTDNAIYYTPATGSIVLELKNVGDSVEFTVTDTGMGVPKNEQQHLFTKFYRAGNARKARPDGTGLGLFMAKKVIVASGGSLIFNSIEGKGSTFGFKFNTPTK